MTIARIEASKQFRKRAEKLSPPLQQKLKKALLLFRSNPLHPSLRLHQLSGKWEGYWSISLDRRYRAIFLIRENGDVLFLSVGTHAIYE